MGDALKIERSVDSFGDQRIRRRAGLLHGIVRGRRYAHNPHGHSALAILSQAAAALLDAADGRTVSDIVSELAPQPGPYRDALIASLPVLIDNGLVTGPDVSQRKPAPAERTFNLWVHVTNQCNLRCPYCYVHKSEDHLAEPAAQRILDTIEATAASGRVDRIHVRYAGGEPMLRLDAMRRFHQAATERCKRHGVRFSAAILTNGTALPPGALDWLIAHKISVSVSIDGLHDTQDTMRPTVNGHGSFALLERTLNTYLAAGVRPYVLITIGNDNLAGLPELTRWLLDRGLGFRYSLERDLQWRQAGGQAGRQAGRQAGEQVGGHDQQHDGRDAGIGGDGILHGEPLRRLQTVFAECYALIEADMLANHAAETPGLRARFRSTHVFCDLSLWRPVAKACGAGDSFLALGHDGTYTPCQAALNEPGPAIDGASTLIEHAQRHRPFGDFKRTNPGGECARCRHAPSCAGGCPLLLHRRDGHISGRSPYCDVFKFVIPRIVRLAALEMILAQQSRTPAGLSVRAPGGL